MENPTLYEILEVSEDASPQDLRASHRRLMRRLHPDMPTGDPQRAALVNDAWVRLSDPAGRASYDLALRYERERCGSEADDQASGASETEDAESWDDGWGAVSGDGDDAPRDLFEETPDQDETEPPPGDDETDATGGDAEPDVPGWGAPIEDAPHDAPSAAARGASPRTAAAGPAAASPCSAGRAEHG